MKNILFIGDSLTSGDNNNKVSFVNYVDFGVKFNLGVSGTTLGEYAIYPVDGYSLLSQLRTQEIYVADADEIYLEYGANDVSAIVAGNVGYTQVLISFVKAIDFIKQINPHAKIYALVLSLDKTTLQMYSMMHVNYLNNDYFKDCDINCSAEIWYKNYKQLIADIERIIPVIPLFVGNELLDNMDADNIHPNDKGYRIAANNLTKFREVMINESIDYRN